MTQFKAGIYLRIGMPLKRSAMRRHTLVAFIAVCVCVTLSATSRSIHGQGGLRAALDRLDTNQDGIIEPTEITPRARPYLERITWRQRRIQLDEANSIERLQEAAREYYASLNGQSDRSRIRVDEEGAVKTFEPSSDQPLIPEFGLGEVKFAYTVEDLEEAEGTLERCDANGDGFVDRQEARRNRWTHRDPFDDDLDGDDRLSRLELTQRYARRRLLDDASGELRLQEWRRESTERYERRRDERNRQRGQFDPNQTRRGDYRLTADLLGRFDANGDRSLQRDEVETLGVKFSQLDGNRDGDATVEEINAFIAEVQGVNAENGKDPPLWFKERDSDMDGQIQMREFADDWSEDKIAEFRYWDLNDDGLLTAEEVLDAMSVIGGAYRNSSAEVIIPGKSVISEIEITDDFQIKDLNVQVSITHSNVQQISAFLTGPDGQRIELFEGIGGSGDHFADTTFDDEAATSIHRARPPFEGSYQPLAVAKKQPGLSEFKGKSIKGVWQLVVRGSRSDRYGMLNRWSLIAEPE